MEHSKRLQNPTCNFLPFMAIWMDTLFPLCSFFLMASYAINTDVFFNTWRRECNFWQALLSLPLKSFATLKKSLHTALQFEFPGSRLSGCHYHFGQSLWRKLQSYGLAERYRNDRRFKRLVRRFMSIGFLPTLLVRNNFNLLRASGGVQRKIQRYPAFADWINYMGGTYVDQNALFPPVVWNVHKRNSDTRTNNHVEGWYISCILELRPLCMLV